MTICCITSLVYTGHHVFQLSLFQNDLGGYSVPLTIGHHHCNTDSPFQIKMHRLWRNEHIPLVTDLKLTKWSASRALQRVARFWRSELQVMSCAISVATEVVWKDERYLRVDSPQLD